LFAVKTRCKVLRRERNAVILAHPYQEGRNQDLGDFVRDSLDLSRNAAVPDPLLSFAMCASRHHRLSRGGSQTA
jgi:quinolinate synthase